MIKDNYPASATEVVEDPNPVLTVSGNKANKTEPQEAFNFTPAALSALGAALLAACGDSASYGGTANAVGADSANGTYAAAVSNSATNSQPTGVITPQGNTVSAAGFNNYPVATNASDAARFLLQCQLSASDADISTVQASTFAAYLQLQFNKPIGQTG